MATKKVEKKKKEFDELKQEIKVLKTIMLDRNKNSLGNVHNQIQMDKLLELRKKITSELSGLRRHFRYLKKRKVIRQQRRSELMKKVNKNPYCVIALFSRGHFREKLSKTYKYDKARERYFQLIEENEKNIIYEKKWIVINTGKRYVEANYEILLLRKRQTGETQENYFRDEYGRVVEHKIIDNDKYLIMEKHKWFVEETFWVWGYNPTMERKTFTYIVDNLLLININDNEYFRNIYLFKNKVIIQYDKKIDIVFCKTPREGLRLYNSFEEICTKRYNGIKIKNILFSGQVRYNAEWLINLLIEETGWSSEQILTLIGRLY